MAILFAILLTVIVICVLISRNKQHEQQSQPEQQPTHFDLLDDNGDPLSPKPSKPAVSVHHQEDKQRKVKRLRYFCIKDKGYHVTVWPKDNRIGEVLEFTIAGMSYRDNIDDFLGEHVGTLEAEPTNEYDPNAIKILAEDGHHVGYVPKDMTSEIRNSATLPCTCYFYIGENAGTYFSDCYIKL